MPTIIVDVMPKPTLLDPQGKAIAAALARTSRGQFQVRQGKRFELSTEAAATPELLKAVQAIAADVLSNGVIEDVVSVRVAEDGATRLADAGAITGGTTASTTSADSQGAAR